ncbi:hypothetical protein HUG15_02500 [Salicibibacter cibarius]|uniref:Uncharacterized protein n=1 Tax=Salicibibacter cibarius TaxID=2743000 RepID=A0A7T7CA65_9BACI|nr:DUF6114 domain-containing protein [Salicibibacter cibarius]QQK74582.1 hypothetical protein HUG15_02500 [Salicibibacter cibarius]
MAKLGLIFDALAMAIIGLLTGAFVGGLVLGAGMPGGIAGGIMAAALLVLFTLTFHFLEWDVANRKVKYASIGILPGVLIGGTQLIGLGIPGAVIFGMVNAIIFAAILDPIIQNLVKKERYVLYPGHYLFVFLLGTISAFLTIQIVGITSRMVDFEMAVSALPLAMTNIIVFGTVLIVYFIGLAVKKRQLESWRMAFKARWLLLTLSAGLGIALVGVITSVHYGIVVSEALVAGAAFVLPYGIALLLPLSFGYLAAQNSNRPVMGSVFSLVGGLAVLAFGISVAPMLLLPGSGLMWAGLIFGLFMVMLSFVSLTKPEMNVFTGSSIIIFSILSFIGAAGGLIIGGLLGIAGGVLIAAWDGSVSKEDDHDEMEGGPKDISSASPNTVSG